MTMPSIVSPLLWISHRGCEGLQAQPACTHPLHRHRHPRHVADIRPRAASSIPCHPTALGKTLIFTADDGASGTEVWRSDGTTAGTVPVVKVPAPLLRHGGR
jgi:hypothetical protein